MRYQAFLAAAALLMFTSCGGGQVSNERRVVRFGQFRCTQPGVDVRKETTMSTNVSASLGSVGGDTSSTTTEEGSIAASTTDRFFALLKSLKDAKVETGQSLTRKHERIAKLAGRGSELEVITYKLCEAAGNGLISKANYQKFLEISLQAPPAPAGAPGL